MEYCTFTEPQQGFSYDEQLAFARATERAGFDGFFRSDHFMRMGSGDPLPGPTDAWTTLAGLARETTRIRLGTLVSSAAAKVGRLAELGAQRIYFQTVDMRDLDQTAYLGADVLPLLPR